MRTRSKSRRLQRGSTIVTALVFMLVIATLLSGVGLFSISHQERAYIEANFASSLAVAEAGVNYELRKISLYQPADLPPGNSYAFAPGAFRVKCTRRDDETVAWN